METSTELVCGILSEELLRRIVGDAPFSTSGRGLDEQTWAGRNKSAECRVVDDEAQRRVLSVVLIEDSDRVTRWRRMLDEEADGKANCYPYDGDPGDGYGCTHDTGTFAHGASVNVMSGDRLFRVTVYNWPDASPEERRAAAEDIVRDIDANVTAYERESGS